MLAALVFVTAFTGVDIAIADWLYDPSLSRWPLSHDAGWPRVLFYDGPKYVLGGLGGWLLAGLLKPALLRPLHLSVRDARFLLSCLVLVPVTVALLKYQSGTSCVRELLRYGGIEPDAYGHLSLARLFDAAKPHGCWPSGHVSGGFALLALGFVGRTRRTRALLWLCGAAIGTAMGTYQVLRGAHFVSHVLATALVAQALVCLLSGLLMPQPRPESGSIHE